LKLFANCLRECDWVNNWSRKHFVVDNKCEFIARRCFQKWPMLTRRTLAVIVQSRFFVSGTTGSQINEQDYRKWQILNLVDQPWSCRSGWFAWTPPFQEELGNEYLCDGKPELFRMSSFCWSLTVTTSGQCSFPVCLERPQIWMAHQQRKNEFLISREPASQESLHRAQIGKRSMT
jgi:hypothetical protein